MNERESVNIPMKCDNSPRFDRVLICDSIASFWSRNHQPLPNCILPGIELSWKLPIIVQKT